MANKAQEYLKKNQMAHKMKAKNEVVKGSGGSVWGMSKKDFHKYLDLKYAGMDAFKKKLHEGR